MRIKRLARLLGAAWRSCWLAVAIRRASDVVIRQMLLAFAVALTLAVVAQAGSGDEHAPGIAQYWPIIYALLGGLVSGAIQYGAVKQTLRDHDRRISEAHALAQRADDKMSTHVDAWHRGD